jgi:radical SAM superfamily enzyme YgiQ (UPF0313 family)
MTNYPQDARVLLVNPGTHPELAPHEPFNLGFLAAYIEARGYRVWIADQMAGQDVAGMARAVQPHLVGITSTTPVVGEAYQQADRCRAMGYPVVMGGVHPAICTEEALGHADMVVKGEGERALLKILTEGIGSGIVTADPIEDLDEVPMPARHLIDMEFYLTVKKRILYNHLYFARRRDRVAGLLTARGCPYSCIFCHNSWRGLKLRFHSAERVLEELRTVVHRHRIDAVFFMDDDFFAHKRRLKQVCESLIDHGPRIRWACQARVKGLREEHLRLAREAGCQQVTFGFESGSQRILDILKNGTTTVEDNARAVELCRKAGVTPAGTFMVGNPTETVEDIASTRKFIHDHGLKDISIHVTTPFPGTKLWEWCEERGLVPEVVDYASLNTATNRALPACDTIPPQEVERLRWEITLHEVVLRNKLKFLKLGLVDPVRTSRRVFAMAATMIGERLGGLR